MYWCPLLDITGNFPVRWPCNFHTSTNAENTLCVFMLVGVGAGSGESPVILSDVLVTFVVDCKFLYLCASVDEMTLDCGQFRRQMLAHQIFCETWPCGKVPRSNGMYPCVCHWAEG
jgi:hypothetical protein